MQLTNDQRALVEKHIGLVHLHLSRHVHLPACPTRDREADDLYQEGFLALIQAAQRHVETRHGPFAAFALPRIKFAIAHALRERFSTLRVPAAVQRRQARPKASGDDESGSPASELPSLHALGEHVSHLAAVESRGPDSHGVTIRDRINEKYTNALGSAAAEWKRRRHRPRSAALADRIVAERLTISEPEHRTPLRQIARDLGASSSNVARCEQFLIRGVACRLERDDQYETLRRLARRSPEGLDASIDVGVLEALRDSRRHQLLEQFHRLDDTDKGAFLMRAAHAAVADPARFLDTILHRLSEEQMQALNPPATRSDSRPRRTRRPVPRKGDASRPDRTEAASGPATKSARSDLSRRVRTPDEGKPGRGRPGSDRARPATARAKE